MLFWLVLAVFVLLVAACVVVHFVSLKRHGWSDIPFPLVVFTFITSIFLVILLFILGANHTEADAQVARMEARYDMLVYQLENEVYENDNDLGKRGLMLDIQSWNEDVAFFREAQHNLWTGIFYPDIYDQFEFIELE